MHRTFFKLTLGLLSFSLFAQAQSSDDNPRLKAALARFPDADANKDGKLTKEEAKAYIAANPQLQRKKQAKPEEKPAAPDVKATEEVGDQGVSEAMLKLYEARMFEGVPYRLLKPIDLEKRSIRWCCRCTVRAAPALTTCAT